MNSTATYLNKLRGFYASRKRMPSYGELAKLLRYKSRNAAHYMVNKWVAAGILEKDDAGKVIPGRLFHSLRVLGMVKAGWPSPAEEELVDTISLDDWLITNKEASYMLKVSGDSMIDAGIRPDDMVILERGRTPKNGDIVVAEIDHEWTMKYFEKRGSVVTLQPANSKYQPIVPNEELKIAGVVRAVVRKY